VQSLLGINAHNRKVVVRREKYILQETTARYNVHFDAKNSGLSTDNRLLWDGL